MRNARTWKLLTVVIWLCAFTPLLAQESGPARASQIRRGTAETASVTPQEGDSIIHNFRFKSGEVLPELNLHYATLGAPERDAKGMVTNAVLVLHGTGGSGQQFLSGQFAGVLFGPGQLLDASRYFIILPDSIGHGHSSKPSDGLHARFPKYDYDDMVRAQHQLLTEGLRVNHLRLVMGTSMGCMHSWVWGESYPHFMDALLPLACLPVQIAGRNRIARKMIMDSFRTDPEWNNGKYKSQPRGLKAALYILLIMGSSPLQMQRALPTQAQADKFLEDWLQARLAATDANDMLYQVDSSRRVLASSSCPLAIRRAGTELIAFPWSGSSIWRSYSNRPGVESEI